MIVVLTFAQARQSVARSLSVEGGTDDLSDVVLVQALRRAVHILAPCSAHELVRSVTQAFAPLGVELDDLTNRVEDLLSELVAFGDILEMRAAAADPWAIGYAYTLRGAPPSFVSRKDRTFAILGVAGDQLTPLTRELEDRVVHHGVVRLLQARDGEDLAAFLRELGLLELSERAWLRLPKVESASTHVAAWRKQLAGEPSTSRIDGLHILDSAKPASYYSGRWCEPRWQHDGMYVARRPQLYGNDLWCVVELEKGEVRRFKDLNAPGDRQRPMDVAWRLQAALDAVGGKPQRFRTSPNVGENNIVRFNSPIPSWAERHLALSGVKTKADRCLFSFDIPNNALESEKSFLRESLWLEEASAGSSGD